MKKQILFSVLLIPFMITANAQVPTLTFANTAPVPGDFYSSTFADTAAVSYGPAGSNQTWDFSNLIINSTQYDINWILPSTTPYASSFPTATVSYNYSNLYSYQVADASGWSLIGYGTSANIWSFDDPSTYLSYPLTFGGSYTDPHHATSFYGGVMHYKRGMRTVNADAWGTLILPSGSYSNILRVKTIFFEKDSSSLGVDSGNVYNYSWYDGTNKIPVMEIGYVFNESGVLTYKSVRVASQYSEISETEFSGASIRIMPNPVTDYITFDSDKTKPVFLQILNLNGRVVFGNRFYSKNERIDLSNLSGGIYIIQVCTDEETVAKKFIKL